MIFKDDFYYTNQYGQKIPYVSAGQELFALLLLEIRDLLLDIKNKNDSN
jgi:hypothetical protein